MYLSANVPRWMPVSEQDLRDALDAGLLEETHYVELKREVAAGRSANKELARDLSQFAIDGGTIVIGVQEQKDGTTPTLAPVELSGLPERVEQIARTIPDPPLPVTCQIIPSAADSARGYVLVSVPVSGTAPHMVDGVYYGRGDKTKVRLSDSEVLRYHRARTDAEEAAAELLEAYVRRDPVPTELRRQAHMFFVAAPVAPRREMLLDAVHGDQWHSTFHQLKNAGLQPAELLGRDRFSPDLDVAGSLARRADGAAVTAGLTSDRRLSCLDEPEHRFNEDALELELSEDGAVRLLTTRLSDQPREGAQVLFAVMIPVLTRRVLSIAAAVADHCGYQGPWLLGVAATGIAGQAAWTEGYGLGYSNTRLAQDQDDYRATTTASYAELTQTPGAVTSRLVGRLLRSLSEAETFSAYTTDPEA